MSGLLGSIFGTLGNLFGNFLPSWGNKPSDNPPHDNSSDNEPDNGNNEDSDDISDSSSEYNTVSISSTRWYSASRGFLCHRERSKSNEVEFFNGITYWIELKNKFSELTCDWFFIKVDKKETLEEAHKWYTNESIAISFESNGHIDMRNTGTYAATSLCLFQDATKGRLVAKDYLKKKSIGSQKLLLVQ
jgi:hypothetical protein